MNAKACSNFDDTGFKLKFKHVMDFQETLENRQKQPFSDFYVTKISVFQFANNFLFIVLIILLIYQNKFFLKRNIQC